MNTARSALHPTEGSVGLQPDLKSASRERRARTNIRRYRRAFDVENGKELWKGALPAGGHATPMTYRAPNGKQYVVIAAGGHPKISEEPLSDTLVAFALDTE